MTGFLVDENFNRYIVRGLRRRNPRVDVVLAQEVGLSGADDHTLLAWAAIRQRVVLSHDIRTLARQATEMIRNGEPVSGVLLVGRKVSIGKAIEEIQVIAECSESEEWDRVIAYVPPWKGFSLVNVAAEGPSYRRLVSLSSNASIPTRSVGYLAV